MKKVFINYLLPVMFFAVIISGLLIRQRVWSSSIVDNTSNGITLQSNARVYQRDCKSATEFDLPTANPAVLDEYGIGSVCEFTDATQDVVLAEYRVPGDMDLSPDPNDSTLVQNQPYIQLHWSAPTADPTGDVVNVRWRLRYKWLSDDVTTDLTDGSYEATTDTTINVATYAKCLVISNIQLTKMSPLDDRLHLQITRVGDATQDTNTGQDANLFDACLFYIADKIGEAL